MSLPQGFLTTPIAHRALHGAAGPENSRAAIRAASERGYGIEIDLQMSVDGAAMVFHDYALDRLTDATGPVAVQTADQLAQIPLKGGAEGIPTLPEVLDLVAGRVPLLIEIKDQDGGMGPEGGPLEVATAHALQGYDGPVAVMSFNPHSMVRMAELAPHLPRGLVTSAFDPERWPLSEARCAELRAIPDYDAVGAVFISHEAGDLDRPRVAELQAAGAHVLCWTITSPEAEAEARKVAQNVTFEGYLPAIRG